MGPITAHPGQSTCLICELRKDWRLETNSPKAAKVHFAKHFFCSLLTCCTFSRVRSSQSCAFSALLRPGRLPDCWRGHCQRKLKVVLTENCRLGSFSEFSVLLQCHLQLQLRANRRPETIPARASLFPGFPPQDFMPPTCAKISDAFLFSFVKFVHLRVMIHRLDTRQSTCTRASLFACSIVKEDICNINRPRKGKKLPRIENTTLTPTSATCTLKTKCVRVCNYVVTM